MSILRVYKVLFVSCTYHVHRNADGRVQRSVGLTGCCRKQDAASQQLTGNRLTVWSTCAHAVYTPYRRSHMRVYALRSIMCILMEHLEQALEQAINQYPLWE